MKRLLALLGALVALLAVALPASAQEEQVAPDGFAVLHRVDASTPATNLWVIADDYATSRPDVSLATDGVEATVTNVGSAVALGYTGEVVYVLDTRSDLSGARRFDAMLTSVANEILDLPENVKVGVVAAADSATTVSALTNDHRSVAREVADLELSVGSVTYNALDKAAALFDEEPAPGFRTVVIVTSDIDTGSAIELATARTSMVRRGIQLVAVAIDEGDPALSTVVGDLGGTTLSADDGNSISAAVAAASTSASDRLVVSYSGSTDYVDRVNSVLTVDGRQLAFSYPGAVDTFRLIGLDPIAPAEESGIAFFRSESGKMAAVGLVFLAIGLGVYALGTLFAMGESSLEGLINRYSGEGDAAALNAEESAIVQTALVKRAVELSESFAEDRGFLVKIEGMLERAKLPLRAGEAMSIFAAGTFFAGAVGFILIGGFIGAVILMMIAAFGQIGVINFLARRRIRKFEQQLPDTLQLLAGTLRAGYSLPQGLEAVSNEISDPMGYELRRVMTEARLGRELEESMAATAERLDSPDFAWAVMAIAIQREVGGNLNELLMTVADTMIQRERLKGEVAALTAEGKMSAILLGSLPPGLGLVMWALNPEYINVLFNHTLGNIFLGLGVISSLVGFAWMKKVMTIDV